MWSTLASDMWSVNDLDLGRSSPESTGSADSTHLSATTASGGEEIDSPPPCRTASVSKNNNNNSNNNNNNNITKKQASSGTLTTKPKLSYIALISNAILETSDERLLLCEIYSSITDKYPYYALTGDSAWKNSIRHNLSLNECFIKNGRSDNGKGNYWAIHPACKDDFNRGDFRRRQARRKSKRSLRGVESTGSVNQSLASSLSYPYNIGYVTMNKMPTGYPPAPSCYQQLPGQYGSSSVSPAAQPSFMMPQPSFSTSSTSHPSFLSSSSPQYSPQLTSYASYLHAHSTAGGASPNVNTAQFTQLGSLSGTHLSVPQYSVPQLSAPQLYNPSASLFPTTSAFYPASSTFTKDNFQFR